MNISTNFDQNISHFHEILDISKNFDRFSPLTQLQQTKSKLRRA